MDNCKICKQEVKAIFKGMILNKYDVQYYKCVNCGFIQTDAPFWLDEAYQHAITKQDVGLLFRNLYITPILESLIAFLFNVKGKFIDYGGGFGVLTRIMRDRGYQFFRYDTYCENIFAEGFDHYIPNEKPDYEMLTSFEVFEHLENPVAELQNMLKWSSNIFFSTELQPAQFKSPDDWWYVMPETGQHIALYTARSLELLGEQYGLNFYTNGINLHLFTRKNINSWLFKLTIKFRVAKLFSFLKKNKHSLINEDFLLVKNSI